jgi:hypothetical protein
MTGEPGVTIILTAVDEELYTRLLALANRMKLSVPDVAALALSSYLEEK